MNSRKLIIIAIIILGAVLIGLMAFDSSTGIVSENKGNVSIAVTGDVMFARNMQECFQVGKVLL